MLRHHVQKVSDKAKRYYQAADYYAEGMDQRAALGGDAAKLLGVEGSLDKTHFERLCDNLHPVTDEKLTLRMKGERIVGIDLTFDGPKGYGVLTALTGDVRLREALHLSAEETMEELQQAAATTRVRKGGRAENRTTGNLVWYRAPHETTRPVDGVPDMQPHDHYFVLNATYDAEEKQWKAANLYDILRDMPYYQAAFHQRLARRLQDLGYGVERKGKYFEVTGVPQSVINKFSRRKQLIEETAAQEGITNPILKSMLGAKTREHKGDNFTSEQLRRLWASRLSQAEMDQLADLVELAQERAGGSWHQPAVSAEQALEHGAAHVFERKSSAPVREVLAEALTYGVGAFPVEEAWQHVESADRFTAEVEGRLFVASHKVFNEEKLITKLAARGLATQAPLNPGWEIEDTRLNVAQRAAVHHLLGSKDFVTMVIGDAGVGKTTLLKDAVRGAEEGAQVAGKKVFAFAPSAAASRGTMREEGFEGADTVATLLVNQDVQARVRGQVILIDEAALLGTKDMAAVLQMAKDLRARVWLVGDDKQHRAVMRGAPFELLQSKAGITPVRVAKIQRQRGPYKQAVELARDKPAEAIGRLKDMGWLQEVPDDERYKVLAADYLKAVQSEKVKGKWRAPTALVVAPTHAEGAKVTAAIRDARRADDKLGPDHEVMQLTNMYLTEAERADPNNFQPGMVLQFGTRRRQGASPG